MEIKIKQAEIELAVKRYVLSLLTVKDDTDIKVEFSATRGPDGLTAMVDVIPAAAGAVINSPEQKAEKAETVDEPVPEQAAQTTTQRKPRITLADKAAAKATEQPVEEPDTKPATDIQEEEQKAPEQAAGGFKGFEKEADQEEVEEVADEPVQEEEQEKRPEQPVRKSLFVNLGKPTNS